MPDKLPIEKIIKIRREIRKGKSRRQLAKEMNLSVDTVCKYGKHITPGKINDNLKNIIRKEVISGKTKKLVAERYVVSYSAVRNITKDIKKRISNLQDELIQIIQKQVRNGKTKKQVSIETGISYYTVLNHTKGIVSDKELSISIDKKIKDLKQNGISDRKIAEELGISEITVKRHSIYDKYKYCKYSDVPQCIIEEIRTQVKSGKDKLQVARIMQISYEKVKRFTKDISGSKGNKRNKKLSDEMIKKIRKEVKGTKTKTDVARKFHLKPYTVYYHTKDIIIRDPQKPGLSGKPLEFLQEIIRNGYALPSMRNSYQNYLKIKKKFPNIERVQLYGKVIYFLEEKADLACKKFLQNLPKKITNYHELKQVVDVFKTQMKNEEKIRFIQKK